MPKPTGPQFEAFLDPSRAWGSDYAGNYSAEVGLRPLDGADRALQDVLEGAGVDWWGPVNKTAQLRTKDGNRSQWTDLGEHKTATSAVKAVAKKLNTKIKPTFKEEDVRPMADLIQRIGYDEFKAGTQAIAGMSGGRVN